MNELLNQFKYKNDADALLKTFKMETINMALI